MELPHLRLARFLVWAGERDELGRPWSQERLGQAIERSQASVSSILAGTKLPDRFAANGIQRVTADWPEGPILSVEWDGVERDRERAKAHATGTDGN